MDVSKKTNPLLKTLKRAVYEIVNKDESYRDVIFHNGVITSVV